MSFFSGIFKKFFKKRNVRVVGIDIGSSAIKVVELRQDGGKVYLQTYGSLALGPYGGIEIGRATSLPVPKVAGALKDLLRESGVTTSQSALSVPFSSSLVSIMSMPRVTDDELEQMVPIEARKYVPVPINEVILDWSIIPSDDEGSGGGKKKDTNNTAQGVEVLMIAIHNDIVRSYEEVMSMAQLNAAFFEVEIFSAIRSVLEVKPEPALVIDMGAATTKLYVIKDGGVRDSHIIGRGSQNITAVISKALGISIEKAEALKRKEGLAGMQGEDFTQSINLTLDYIFSEAQSTITAFEAKNKKKISAVYLAGGGANLVGLKEAAHKALGKDVFMGDPFSRVGIPDEMRELTKNVGPEFAVAVGLALRGLKSSD